MPTTPDGTAKVSIPIEYSDRQIEGQMHATDDSRTELAETNAASPFESGLPLPESERGQSSLATCRPLRVVAISDTHGMHRTLKIPDGDVLLHGGDFTSFGKRKDVLDFNEWLGTLPHPHKLVVLGNHEANADWVDTASALLTNATLLNESEAVIRRPGDFGPKELCDPGESADGPGRSFRVFGTSFYWPVETGSTCYFTPPYARIPRASTSCSHTGHLRSMASTVAWDARSCWSMCGDCVRGSSCAVISTKHMASSRARWRMAWKG